MSRFPELNRRQLERFLKTFSRPGTLKFRNNKWVGLNRSDRPFTVHEKHGTTRKFAGPVVGRIAKDLGVSREEFERWHEDV